MTVTVGNILPAECVSFIRNLGSFEEDVRGKALSDFKEYLVQPNVPFSGNFNNQSFCLLIS